MIRCNVAPTSCWRAVNWTGSPRSVWTWACVAPLITSGVCSSQLGGTGRLSKLLQAVIKRFRADPQGQCCTPFVAGIVLQRCHDDGALGAVQWRAHRYL